MRRRKSLKPVRHELNSERENAVYVLLHEIQLMTVFEDVLYSLLHIENVDIYVTGSNSKFFSKDVITAFLGR
ncbi:MAG: AAA family ATPase [Veillonellaceae bacterium]|nr:AAA family ATPase [Veillonellaceae bacterium]